MRERAIGSGEVDEDVRARERRVDVGRDGDAGGAPAGFAGIATHGGTVGDVERRGERETGLRQHGLDQRAAHPAPGAGNGDPDVGHRHGTGLAAGS